MGAVHNHSEVVSDIARPGEHTPEYQWGTDAFMRPVSVTIPAGESTEVAPWEDITASC